MQRKSQLRRSPLERQLSGIERCDQSCPRACFTGGIKRNGAQQLAAIAHIAVSGFACRDQAQHLCRIVVDIIGMRREQVIEQIFLALVEAA